MTSPRYDMSEVVGQSNAIAIVERATRLRENMLLQGPPGTGKTMIARRITTLMPTLGTYEETWLAAVYEACGLGNRIVMVERPFRAPHHTIGMGALAGGSMRIAELQLAAFGVLFLDEVTEFRHDVIDSLATAWDHMSEKIRPIIVASANRCLCGWHGYTGHMKRTCVCTPISIARHTTRVEWCTSRLRLQHVAVVEPLPRPE